jgi:hypothetical protein
MFKICDNQAEDWGLVVMPLRFVYCGLGSFLWCRGGGGV